MKLIMEYENPFNPQFGRRPAQFVGRDLIVNDFVSSVGYPNRPERTTILTGLRGSGKTAILSDVHAILEQKGAIVVDVTANAGMLDNMIGEFVRKIEAHSRGKSLNLKSLSFGAFGFSFGAAKDDSTKPQGFRYVITKLLDELMKKKVNAVFLIDEVHNKTPEMREFAITYQHLIREEYSVYLLMAGLPGSVSDVLNDDVMTFLRRSYRVYLENIATKAVEIAYSDAFGAAERKFSAGALETAAASTFGYPYLIQLIGYYLWKTNRLTMDDEDVFRAVELSKIDLFRNVHDLLIRDLSAKDIEFLMAMQPDERESDFGDIVKRMDVTKGYASKYRARLIDAGIVQSQSYGKLTMSPPYMKEYLNILDA